MTSLTVRDTTGQFLNFLFEFNIRFMYCSQVIRVFTRRMADYQFRLQEGVLTGK